MMRTDPVSKSSDSTQRFGCLQVLGISIIAVLVTALITTWAVRAYFFPSGFEPITLSPQEERTLAAKLKNLETLDDGTVARVSADKDASGRADGYDEQGRLKPEAYSEAGASREIRFTERELNALLAKNTDLARKLAVDLSDDLVSAKLLLPMDEDLPVFGGRTLRVKTGVLLAHKDDKPVVVLKGVTVMGIPIPNAWLGGLKNIDLIEEFGKDEGFWHHFSEGVASVAVEDGRVKITLKE